MRSLVWLAAQNNISTWFRWDCSEFCLHNHQGLKFHNLCGQPLPNYPLILLLFHFTKMVSQSSTVELRGRLAPSHLHSSYIEGRTMEECWRSGGLACSNDLHLEPIAQVLTQLSFGKSYSAVVCHLLSTSISSFTWVLWTRGHPSQWGRCSFSQPPSQVAVSHPWGCVWVRAFPVQGVPVSATDRDRVLGTSWLGFIAVLHCLQQKFLSPCCASCPINCWSSYLEWIILYIVS